MAFSDNISQLISARRISLSLSHKSADSQNIQVLQAGLIDLGFELKSRGGKSDQSGIYGPGTIKSVKDFAKRNGKNVDGKKVSQALGRLLVHRHLFLDDLRHLADAADNPTVLRELYRNSAARVPIAVLQEVLNELGYGEQLKWTRYGADGDYGKSTAAAVKAFAEDSGISSDGSKVTQAMANAALGALVPYYGKRWRRETPMVAIERLSITRSNKKVLVSDGEHSKKFGIYKRGLYTVGSEKPAKFIDNNTQQLRGLGLNSSSINVMLSVSENEGNLDAINTWDNAIFTFGMFQWTIGQGNSEGELPALLKKIKIRYPDVFEHYYGRHGLGVDARTDNKAGRFTLNGRKLTKAVDKELLRTEKWAFYFWKSAQDSTVKSVEVEHSLSRLGTFYRSANRQVAGHDIADIITSEYGVALILDNHVNRPAYVHKCLNKAVAQVTPPSTPATWKTSDENKVIDAYLEIRQSYGRTPMTDAAKRARNTKRARDNGLISDRRGSFKGAL